MERDVELAILDNDKNVKIFIKHGMELIDITSDFNSEILVVNKEKQTFFLNTIDKYKVENDTLGIGEVIKVNKTNNLLEQTIIYSKYERYPNIIFVKALYKNISSIPIKIDSYINNNYMIKFQEPDIFFWGYMGASYESRPNWIQPLKVGFVQENYMGMNSSDYGGGTPVIDIWNDKFGVAIGHTELKQYEVYLPIHVSEYGAHMSFKHDVNFALQPQGNFETLETFIMAHQGDCFTALRTYRNILEDKGLKFNYVPPEDAYKTMWHSWGYERDFSIKQIYKTLPKIKELDIQWVCLDDGYQVEEGDLELSKVKFPNGDQDMKDFVRTLHENGLKAQLWWIPLAVDPKSKIYEKHPDWLLLNEYGEKQHISWWDSYYLCPAYKPVQEDIKHQLYKILVEWGFDGLKIDGQHLNSAPKCFNLAHNHKDPSESIEWMSLIIKMIYEIAREIKKDVIVYYCPCGATYSIFTMPYYNIAVASDPKSSWQVRLKGHVIRALGGKNIVYHGDHVELTDNYTDFASIVGIGAVIDTKFTWPPGSMGKSILRPGEIDPFGLSEGKEKLYKKWIDIYNNKMLSKGEYIGDLYTIGYDVPETHVILKDKKLYFSFYVEEWDDTVEFRGLEQNVQYRVFDYVNNRMLGIVNAKKNKLKVKFNDYLLVELEKIKSDE